MPPSNRLRLIAVASAALALALGRSAGAAEPLKYRLIIIPGSHEANGVNNRGEVVGRTSPYSGSGKGFYYKSGQMTTFGTGDAALAYAINDSGLIVGTDDINGQAYAMLADSTGASVLLPSANSAWAEAYDVNDAGQIVGFVETAEGETHAALWEGIAFHDLSAGQEANGAYGINAAGTIAGWTGSPSAAAFITPVPHGMGADGNYSIARGISDSVFVAGSSLYDNYWEAWVYDGSFHTIITGGNGTYAADVNKYGQVVGSRDGTEAFLYQDGIYHRLRDLVVDGSGTLLDARGINDAGVIVGLAEEGGFLLVPIDSLAPGNLDTDGDALLDRWEAFGLDLDVDGVREYQLAGANPLHKDVYVEIDHDSVMPLKSEVAGKLRDAFAAVPGSDLPSVNPDGAPGITLHLDVDDGSLEVGILYAAADPPFPQEFDSIKTSFFGTAAERASADHTRILNAKRRAYHYAVQVGALAVDFPDGSTRQVSGLAECGGNDFIVAPGCFSQTGGSWQEQAGTFLHEIGHNFGLLHGGGDDVNFKTNYFSVMNYAWQTPRANDASHWLLDYSHSAGNAAVDEQFLDEQSGFAGISRAGEILPVPYAQAGDPSVVLVGLTNGAPLNFDGGPMLDLSTAADLNHLDAADDPSPGELYVDHDDWAALEFNFRQSADFAEGVHSNCPGSGQRELSAAVIQKLDAAYATNATAIPGATAPVTLAPAATPNPFRAATDVRFTLTAPGRVRAVVVDAAGRLVRTLVDAPQPAGPVALRWNGTDDRGRPLGAGVYFVKIRTAAGTSTLSLFRLR